MIHAPRCLRDPLTGSHTSGPSGVFRSRSHTVIPMGSRVLKPGQGKPAKAYCANDGTELLQRSRRLIVRLAMLWHARRIVAGVEVVCDGNLRRSVALYSRRRKLIKLNVILLEQPEVMPEVVGHELAHLVAFARHGTATRPHGPEWQQLMRTAGLPARRQLRIPTAISEIPDRPKRATAKYIHRCPICQTSWTAKRRMTRWRCPTCMDAGLSGELIIQRRN